MPNERNCALCGDLFASIAGRKYCVGCKGKAHRTPRGRTTRLTWWARRRGIPIVEEVDPTVVYARDHGICYICLSPVDESARGGSALTMDHVIPAAKGGVHSYANVKLAHRRCNCRKKDRIVDIIGFELRDQPGVTHDDTTEDGQHG